jgi:hypothetical protein
MACRQIEAFLLTVFSGFWVYTPEDVVGHCVELVFRGWPGLEHIFLQILVEEGDTFITTL